MRHSHSFGGGKTMRRYGPLSKDAPGFVAGIILALGAFTFSAAAGELTVVSVEPAINAGNVAPSAAIKVHFNLPVMRNTVTTANFWAFARWSGAVQGAIGCTDGDQTITL